MPKCPTCAKEVYFAERVSSIGKDWHRGCLKCAKCKKTLSPGGHSEVTHLEFSYEYSGRYFWNNISTAKISLILKARNSDMSRKCPTCDKTVYMGEKKESLGNWYHPLCLKCRKCGRQLAVGNHAERKGEPYCHNPCYASEFGPRGFGHGGTESHKY
ncbi:unnamed protein product [Porites lobata]|uniref:LIM zinc-binding domain-containing protein n=1 Tax=Porites lobata TaxID=104759 RepID=A0ABN8P4R3_9CNID|nr:unnamed protein product [Porites lobata]